MQDLSNLSAFKGGKYAKAGVSYTHHLLDEIMIVHIVLIVENIKQKIPLFLKWAHSNHLQEVINYFNRLRSTSSTCPKNDLVAMILKSIRQKHSLSRS